MAVMMKIPVREPMLMFGSWKMLRKEKKIMNFYFFLCLDDMKNRKEIFLKKMLRKKG